MKTKKLSIAAQLFLFILGASIIVAVIVGSVAYVHMGNFLQKKCKDDVMEIAVIAAENVDGEIFAKAIEGDETALLMVKDSLSFFLVGDSVTYVYTLMPKDADWFQFVVDTDPEDPGEYAEDYEASSIQTSLNGLIRNLLLTVGAAVLFAVVAALLVAIRMRRNFIKVNDSQAP